MASSSERTSPVVSSSIKIRGARQNNLRNVDVELPRNALVAITGLSGSGKSSLAFDTLFREGQRRFLETLSAYARQFLGRMEKPDVDHVEGLSPAIAVDQKAIQRGPRSTVGTITEIVDHLRVLYARAGTSTCPEHGTPLSSQTPEAIVRQVAEGFAGDKVHVLAPLVRDRKGEHRALFVDLAKKGFVRVRVDGAVRRVEEVEGLERYKRHSIEVVVDRLQVKDDVLSRLREAVELGLDLGKGDLIVVGEAREQGYSTQRTCPVCGLEVPPLEPRLFSFNSPHGSCPTCEGLGVEKRPGLDRVIADPTRSIRAGALAVTRASGGALLFPRVDFAFLEAVGEAQGFDLDTPWNELSKVSQRLVLEGTGDERYEARASWNGQRFSGSVTFKKRYHGVMPALERAFRRGQNRRQVERFLETLPCPTCSGSRLNRFASSVLVGGVGLAEVVRTPIGELAAKLDGLELRSREAKIAEGLLTEIRRRAGFLSEVGLDYLTLDRSADTLSGGEAQRIRLAAQLGAGLQGVLYVLDEPSIGLHPRDHGRLFGALLALRDAGNTVVVVEHDEATLRGADWLIDIGPGPGRHGGRVVAAGPPSEVAKADSPTGALLRGELEMPQPAERRKGNGNTLLLRGAAGFNLKGIDVGFPLGALTVVSGVSGSGKSTLVHHTLQRAVARHLGREVPAPVALEGVEGLEHIEELVFIDATPIGRTPRSNPATYAGAFTPIRDLFASLPEAKMHGWTPGRFSFNVEGGRCEACQGAGAQFVELQFLAPVTVPCDECGGHRFQQETLGVHYRGKSIADVLALTIEEAAELFSDIPKIARPLSMLVTVGLGYLQLGQPSTTLSGGEAQRVKLAKHLQKRPTKHTLYLLDEPTTGLHTADVRTLIGALQKLVDLGHTVILIEHQLDVVRAADHVIDLGPEGGKDGGQLVCAGTPEEIEACAASYTGQALIQEREARGGAIHDRTLRLDVAPRNTLEVVEARTHNLKKVSVEIPRDALTVVTGPSGSGKSSLALDTIHATGRQRFVESLSTYARQFLTARDRPPVERIDGLGPSVAVEARTSLGHPRSTVATTTEIHDHLRVMWARAGDRRCPEHGERLVRTDAGGVTRRILKDLEGESGWLLAPIFGPGLDEPADFNVAFREASEAWRAAGYVRALVDGKEVRLDGSTRLPLNGATVDLVLDRVRLEESERTRIAEAVHAAEGLSGGRVSFLVRAANAKKGDVRRIEYSVRGSCTQCGFQLSEELEPRHFSFNTHAGACPDCDGLGERWTTIDDLLVDRPELPLVAAEAGQPTAVGGKLGRYLTKGKGYYEFLLRTVAKGHRIDLARPFEQLSEAARALLLHGKGARKSYRVEIDKAGASYEMHESFTAGWPGLCGHVDAWHAKAEDQEWRSVLERYMRRQSCPSCAGERLAPGPRSVTVGRKRLPEILALSVAEVLAWLDKLKLSATKRSAVGPVIEELLSRIELLDRVGLGYVSLARPMSTLSGGEARRVRLSASLGSKLVGVCYVLDEPTVGLHPADIDRLTDALLALRDGGNTVIVVEHDESLMRRADWLIDMGPGAGRLGGEVVAAGTPADVEANSKALTGQALRGELALERPDRKGPAASGQIVFQGAKLHNLKGVNVELDFGSLTGICGPSGSGKSTLILDCLVPALRGEKAAGRWKRLRGGNALSHRTVVVDSSPLGRTPSSVPATAIGVMEPLRQLFARTPEARMRGYTPAHFSFNSTKGRCPACDGRGATKVEMQFLADLWLSCEECDGRRYKPEVQEVRYRGRSIADVLDMPSEECASFLADVPAIAGLLDTLAAVGLGYLRLGQSSTTLSAGEAQRVKLAGELLRAENSPKSILILDEPTTGLHKSDVQHLFAVLRRLADRGDAVIVIEHHTDLLAACDRLIELGPGGGAEGGTIVASGTPEELARDPKSITGPWLEFSNDRTRAVRKKAKAGKKRAAKSNGPSVEGSKPDRKKRTKKVRA